jgi:predicted transcriptional regulator
MELCLNGKPFSRNSIQKVLAITPEVINPFYQQAMSHLLSEEEILKGLEKIDVYLEKHLDIIKKPVIKFMSDQEIKTMTLISKYFRVEPHYVIEVFDYLADKGVIEKVSQVIRITPRGKKAVEEIGFDLELKHKEEQSR